MKVIKRDGRIETYNKAKIVKAIKEAMGSPGGTFVSGQAEKIAEDLTQLYELFEENQISLNRIEEDVYFSLIQEGNARTAKEYESYRAVQDYKRKANTSDTFIIGLIDGVDEELLNENSNKNARKVSTQRDLIAGEVSKDIVMRKLLPTDLSKAHLEGTIHIHDMDYALQPMFNCCVVNLPDMLENGTALNGCRIDSPNSFHTACNITSQICAAVASSQFGGQSYNFINEVLAPYARKSYNRYLKQVDEELELINKDLPQKDKEAIAKKRLKKEIRDGIQTIQYQILTLSSTNGQSPFVTFGLRIAKDSSEPELSAMILEEILRQRIKGLPSQAGPNITPTFPKLIYFLNEDNIHPSSKYFYLTRLSAECSVKRFYPDYISEKKMKEMYGEDGVHTPMGCRAFLPPYKPNDAKSIFNGRFNIAPVTINLVQPAYEVKSAEEYFERLDKALLLAKRALLWRRERLIGVTSDVSPIHWQDGAIARLKPGEEVTPYLFGGYATLGLGYIGLYEAAKLITGKSHTTPEGYEFAQQVMDVLVSRTREWTLQENTPFRVYGTPAESLIYRLCKIDGARYGNIKDVTDKGHYTNSYHVDVREEIDAFDKLSFEQQFQGKSMGGMISYVELPDLGYNVDAVLSLVEFIYDNVMYGEVNIKSDMCHICRYEGEISLIEDNKSGDLVWECPLCHNRDKTRMTVTRRTCGYLGNNFWNEGRTKEIKNRVMHL